MTADSPRLSFFFLWKRHELVGGDGGFSSHFTFRRTPTPFIRHAKKRDGMEGQKVFGCRIFEGQEEETGRERRADGVVVDGEGYGRTSVRKNPQRCKAPRSDGGSGGRGMGEEREGRGEDLAFRDGSAESERPVSSFFHAAKQNRETCVRRPWRRRSSAAGPGGRGKGPGQESAAGRGRLIGHPLRRQSWSRSPTLDTNFGQAHAGLAAMGRRIESANSGALFAGNATPRHPTMPGSGRCLPIEERCARIWTS